LLLGGCSAGHGMGAKMRGQKAESCKTCCRLDAIRKQVCSTLGETKGVLALVYKGRTVAKKKTRQTVWRGPTGDGRGGGPEKNPGRKGKGRKELLASLVEGTKKNLAGDEQAATKSRRALRQGGGRGSRGRETIERRSQKRKMRGAEKLGMEKRSAS